MNARCFYFRKWASTKPPTQADVGTDATSVMTSAPCGADHDFYIETNATPRLGLQRR
jgi:hypothetical protein